MSQLPGDQAIADAREPSVADRADVAADAPNVQEKSADEKAAEMEAAAEEKARRMLQQQIAAVDDAEEVCVFLVEDTLDAMFQEMQVLAENASVFAQTSAWASDSLLAGVLMGATQPPASLDRSGLASGAVFDETRQQILKFSEDGSTSTTKAPQSGGKAEPSTSSLRFLRQLLAFLDGSSDQVARELMAFPAAQYLERSAPGKGSTHSAASSSRPRADWEIPSGSMEAFLTHVVDRCHVPVLPSTVAAVCEANATARSAAVRAKATLSQSQITHCVRMAVLAAEQAAQDAMQETQHSQPQDDSTLRRTFRTEVDSSTRPSGVDGPCSGLQICLLEETPPVASAIDRNVPGSIARKVADASRPPKNADQKQLARRVMMALMPGPKESSKWLGLRTRVVHSSQPSVVHVVVDADMDVSIDAKPGADGKRPALSPTKPSVRVTAAPASPSAPPRPSNFARRSFSTTRTSKDARTAGSPAVMVPAEPDAAALSHIFSLGTPRQMTGDELARRHDILAQLEREERQQHRRLATAAVAAMVFPPTACPSEAEARAFQAYVTANSSVTTGVDFALELPTEATSSGQDASPPPVAPRRPEKKKNTSQSPLRRSSAAAPVGGRSKFEAALDPPAFVVHDGVCRVDAVTEQASAYGEATRSPNRKVSPNKRADSPSALDTAGAGVGDRGAGSSDGRLSPSRPLQSAGQQLPQLDTSRLAVGVRAVVRGVEKRGPRRNPSRQSRLKLHNYNAPFKVTEQRRAKRRQQQQLVFDKKTASPPRVRNRHFTGRGMKRRSDYESDDESGSDGGGHTPRGSRPSQGGSDNRLDQPLEAPRRSLLPSHGY